VTNTLKGRNYKPFHPQSFQYSAPENFQNPAPDRRRARERPEGGALDASDRTPSAPMRP
jgi:hypothetical protein